MAPFGRCTQQIISTVDCGLDEKTPFPRHAPYPAISYGEGGSRLGAGEPRILRVNSRTRCLRTRFSTPRMRPKQPSILVKGPTTRRYTTVNLSRDLSALGANQERTLNRGGVTSPTAIPRRMLGYRLAKHLIVTCQGGLGLSRLSSTRGNV